MNLQGRRILVTGGSRGIGAAIVRRLLEAGARVVLHYGHREADAKQVASVAPDRVTLVEADLGRTGSAEALWRAAAEAWGGLDAVVLNAGIYRPAPLDAPDAVWRAVWSETIQVNLSAPADLVRAAVPAFRAQGGGIIVSIASRAAFRGDMPEYLAYAASKGALVAMTRSIARGYGADNILAYVVAPGWVRTEMAEEAVAAYGETELARDIPLGEMAPPEDVAEVVAFLVSGRARHLTGATLDINGASYVH
jgi:3-oxoacyl-[acyl-carrier protein] reductase